MPSFLDESSSIMICHETRGRIAFIENVRDEQICGLFPQFQDLVDRAGIKALARTMGVTSLSRNLISLRIGKTLKWIRLPKYA
jgi:hypothetical protein